LPPILLLLLLLALLPPAALLVVPAAADAPPQEQQPQQAAAAAAAAAPGTALPTSSIISSSTTTTTTNPQQPQQQQQPTTSFPNPDAPPLKFAVINQVHFHLEVVAGAMHVLRGLTSLDVHVYLPAKVLAANWYGFASWMRGAPGVVWRQLKEYDGRERYDLAWFLSPEYHIPYVEQVVAAMKPKVTLLYVHNAHMPDEDFARLRKVSEAAGVPFVTLAPHVARYIHNRTAGTAAAVDPVWVLPVYPYAAAKPCGMQDMVDATSGKKGAPPPCLRGFSVQGRIEASRRNYSEVWQQIADYRRGHKQEMMAAGGGGVGSFRLNILGEAVEKFFVPRESCFSVRASVGVAVEKPGGGGARNLARRVSSTTRLRNHPENNTTRTHQHLPLPLPPPHHCLPKNNPQRNHNTPNNPQPQKNTHHHKNPPKPTADVRDVVAVYKNPPYPVFYDVVSHSLALVPMLASPLYYESKFSSTVYSSMITSVPMIADDRFLDAYTMIDRGAVYYRSEGEEEVDVMFRVAQQDARETWRARAAVADLRDKLNKRATGLLRGWLDEKGAARAAGGGGSGGE
jgi:hypothetical protein